MKRLTAILTFLSLASPASLAAIPDRLAVDTLIGEASNTPAAMLPIACIIRQRGSLAGIYGGRNPVVKYASPALRARARAAWSRSATCHLPLVTRHCLFFGCPADRDYFVNALHYHPVFSIGTITFYHP